MLIRLHKNHLSWFWELLIVVLLLKGAAVILLPLVMVFLTSLAPASATATGSILPKVRKHPNENRNTIFLWGWHLARQVFGE